MTKEFLKHCDDELKSSFRNLCDSFRNKYDGAIPDFFIQVPGRVNLIGEHIDYNGYSVCPMAIKQSILGAVKKVNDGNVFLSNVDNQKYQDYACKIDDLRIKNELNRPPAWYEYVLCGFKGIIEWSGSSSLSGLIIHFHGSIPPAAGLSSSSALVCAAALSLSVVLNIDISKSKMAELTANSERYIGTEGGGMDQAIIFNAKLDSASHISFEPLVLTEVQIPPTGTFVIAQSMVTKNKAASNDFNTRVVECRLSSLIIAKTQDLQNWQKFTKLAATQKELNYTLAEMIKIVKEFFHDGSYTKEEICEILELPQNVLEENFLTRNTKQLNQFRLKARALHVFGEALRVETFCKVCKTNKSLHELGALMSQSHSSLKDLYECSHEELDKLVAVCVKNGALGVRLTGAGWGGCIVALVPSNAAEEFLENVKTEFYSGRVPMLSNIDNLIFITKPYSGAGVFDYDILKE